MQHTHSYAEVIEPSYIWGQEKPYPSPNREPNGPEFTLTSTETTPGVSRSMREDLDQPQICHHERLHYLAAHPKKTIYAPEIHDVAWLVDEIILDDHKTRFEDALGYIQITLLPPKSNASYRDGTRTDFTRLLRVCAAANTCDEHDVVNFPPMGNEKLKVRFENMDGYEFEKLDTLFSFKRTTKWEDFVANYVIALKINVPNGPWICLVVRRAYFQREGVVNAGFFEELEVDATSARLLKAVEWGNTMELQLKGLEDRILVEIRS
jgi:hypothetical protein